MAGTFSDGFPLDPVAAVQSATFLTQQERNEWMAWLGSAGPDDKAELVNTLHEIWVENNKTATQQTASSSVSVEQQAPPPAPAAPISAPSVEAPAQSSLPQAPVAPPPQAISQSVPQTSPTPSTPQNVTPTPEQQPETPITTPQKSVPTPTTASAQPQQKIPPKPQNQQKYTFAKVQEKENRVPPRSSDSTQNLSNRSNERRSQQMRTQQRDERRPARQERGGYASAQSQYEHDTQSSQKESHNSGLSQAKAVGASNFVDLSLLQTDKTRSILETFSKNFTSARREEEKSIGTLQNVILSVEEVVNYSDLLAEKILSLNDTQVHAQKEAAKNRDQLVTMVEDVEIRVDDIQTMVERAQDEIDRLARRQRAFESDVKNMLSEINQQVSGFSTDQFAGSDKLAILNRRLDRLEEVKSVRSQSLTRTTPSSQTSRRESQPQHSSSAPSQAEMKQPPRAQQSAPKPQEQQPPQPRSQMQSQTNQPSSPQQQSAANFMPLNLNNKGSIRE